MSTNNMSMERVYYKHNKGNQTEQRPTTTITLPMNDRPKAFVIPQEGLAVLFDIKLMLLIRTVPEPVLPDTYIQ